MLVRLATAFYGNFNHQAISAQKDFVHNSEKSSWLSFLYMPFICNLSDSGCVIKSALGQRSCLADRDAALQQVIVAVAINVLKALYFDGNRMATDVLSTKE